MNLKAFQIKHESQGENCDGFIPSCVVYHVDAAHAKFMASRSDIFDMYYLYERPYSWSSELVATRSLVMDKHIVKFDNPYIEWKHTALRDAGYWFEDDFYCESCGEYSDPDEVGICHFCERCPECKHEDYCEVGGVLCN